MAIAATFLADFDKFNAATDKAGAKLLSFNDRAEAVGGRLMDLSDYSEQGAPKVDTLTGSFHKFDGVLASAGVNISPFVRGLEDISSASGKTVSSLGALATAGLVAGAAVAGWQFGRFIADMTGSDKIIGDATATLLGWGDSAERAGAKADVLALATKNAGRVITDLTEAMKINQEAADQLALARGRSADAAHETFVQEAALQKELREARSRGDIPALTHDIELHILSQKELSTKYGLTTTAIQYFIDKLKATEAATNAAAAAQKELAKGWETFYDWAADQEAKRQADLKAGFEAWRNQEKAIKDNAGVLDALLRQAAFDTAVEEEKLRFAAQGVNAELEKIPSVASSASESVLSLGSSAQSAAGSFFQMSEGLFSAIRAAQAADSINEFVPAFGRIDSGGISGLRPINPIIRPTAGTSGGGGVNITINGSVLGNKEEIARVVGDALQTNYRNQGGRLPA